MVHQVFSRQDLEHQEPAAQPGSTPPRWLGALAESGPASVILDGAGKLLFANPAYQALAQRIDPNLHGEVGEAATIASKILSRVLRDGGPVEDRQLFKNPHGVTALRSRYWLLPGSTGQNQEIAGLIFDESPEVDAIRAERQSRARFDDIARLTSDWVWEIDESFCFTYVSPRVAEVLGIPAQLVLSHNLFDMGRFDGFEQANRTEHPNPESRVPFSSVHYTMLAADKTPRLFELSGVPVFDEQSGQFGGYRGTATNITAQSEAEDRATRAQLNLISTVESMPQGFVLCDSDDKILLCNSHFEAFITPGGDMISPGADYHALIEKAAKSDIFDFPPDGLDAFVAERIASHKMAKHDSEYQLADGRWVQLSCEMTEDGGAIETWIDITRMKEREAELLEAEAISRHGREQAEHASRTKSEFLANMSHELRTPLNAIIGFSEIIKDEVLGPLGNEQYNNYAADIHDSGLHLLGLINDILDFSKAEAGKITLVDQPMDLVAALEGCARLLAPRVAGTEITIETNIQADFPRVRGDLTRIKQIILNLLSNGVKFTEQGSVTVSAEFDFKAGITVRVCDTGIGIAEEDIDQAFSLFGQVDSALSRKFEGTGLGLPLSRSMAQLHGGDLILESEVGKGTCAIITLPAERLIQP
ncbi:MAG: PAS domain-containing protein [Rhodospirillaceae bacterium]|nr:PAS domain-containing protein [Rhodospirillaceae bacterium]